MTRGSLTETFAPLTPFGATARDFKVSAHARLESAGLKLHFKITAESKEALSRILIPALAPVPARRDGLWETTCFECFIPDEDSTAYLEFNGAPSGDWNLYSFRAYREGMQAAPIDASAHARQTHLAGSPTEFEATWVIPRSAYGSAFAALGIAQPRVSRVGLTSVVQELHGSLSYWALAHSAPQADFHRRPDFTYPLLAK